MNDRPFTKLARAHRAEAFVFALLGTASLLCLVLAATAILSGPPAQGRLVQSPKPNAPQVATYPPRWQADMRTAYHAMLFLLDPRV